MLVTMFPPKTPDSVPKLHFQVDFWNIFPLQMTKGAARGQQRVTAAQLFKISSREDKDENVWRQETL